MTAAAHTPNNSLGMQRESRSITQKSLNAPRTRMTCRLFQQTLTDIIRRNKIYDKIGGTSEGFNLSLKN